MYDQRYEKVVVVVMYILALHWGPEFSVIKRRGKIPIILVVFSYRIVLFIIKTTKQTHVFV